jgi:hypothetical protein
VDAVVPAWEDLDQLAARMTSGELDVQAGADVLRTNAPLA